jgi:hypothetical protein
VARWRLIPAAEGPVSAPACRRILSADLPSGAAVARVRGRLFTVTEVAARAQVTERTVWKDIRAGRLKSVLVDGNRRIPATALARYRRVPFESDGLLSVKDVATILNQSERNIWTAIRLRLIPVIRISRRRLYVSAKARFLADGNLESAWSLEDWCMYVHDAPLHQVLSTRPISLFSRVVYAAQLRRLRPRLKNTE